MTLGKSPALPAPPAELLGYSEELVGRIREEVARAGGWIGFDRYMQIALYEPGLGYYVSGLQKFGAAGDFITAPELGGLFAACIARQCAEVLGHLGGGVILEFGAGSGALAAGILDYLGRQGCLPERYLILEPSAELRARQRRAVAACGEGLLDCVEWLDRLPQPGLRGVVLANEVLDAMPAMRFLAGGDGGAVELGVAHGEAGFEWALPPSGQALSAECIDRIRTAGFDAGYVSEIGLQAEAWVETVGGLLDAGLMLLVDYGFPRREFYHPDRRAGTLMCHYRHHAHGDPFLWPGLQDITAHVDFTAIAKAGVRAGLEVAGYATQGAFLLSLGLTELPELSAAEGVEQLKLAQEIKKLTLPHEMGELFKVIALSRALEPPLAGFRMQDRRRRL
ncbi:MAG: SAM-dependent methyltransferase [Pseudomonadota bacterium]|nr:SAM-dependent methyltransferase [Pseudomonadota bacterium]